MERIPMCWKCYAGVKVPVPGDSRAMRMAGCNKMAQCEWDAACERNNGGNMPLWEDCPLSKEIPEDE